MIDVRARHPKAQEYNSKQELLIIGGRLGRESNNEICGAAEDCPCRAPWGRRRGYDYMRGQSEVHAPAPNESMNLIVTSPPYNLGKEYETRRSQDRYVEEQVACIAESVRLLHPNGSICWQVGNHVQSGEVYPLDIILYPIFKNAELQLRNRIVWTFGHGLHCQKRFSGRHETTLWFTKTDNYAFTLDPVRIPSKYLEIKSFKGSRKGELSGNLLEEGAADVWQLLQQDWEACLWKN